MRKIQISTKNAEYQVISALKNNRNKRKRTGEVFVEGIESIKQVVQAQIEVTRVITHNYMRLSNWGKAFIADLPSAKVVEMSYDLYAELCDRDEPSELLVTAKLEPFELSGIQFSEKPFVLIFDRPSDHGNFGSIVRSANSFGVEAICVVGHGVDFYEPKAIRASLGSVFHTKMVKIQSMDELSGWIAKQKRLNGLKVIGTDSIGDVSLASETLQRPIALVLGNEAKGMSVSLQEMCDDIVRIPISGDVNSLNVSCAGSIFMWDIYRNSLGA